MNSDNFKDNCIEERVRLKKKIDSDSRRLKELQVSHKEDIQYLRDLDAIIARRRPKDQNRTDESGTGKRIEDYIEEIFKSSKEPIMHIEAIYQELIKKDVHLPGKGTVANVVTRISRAKDRFVRVGRGKYSFIDRQTGSKK